MKGLREIDDGKKFIGRREFRNNYYFHKLMTLSDKYSNQAAAAFELSSY